MCEEAEGERTAEDRKGRQRRQESCWRSMTRVVGGGRDSWRTQRGREEPQGNVCVYGGATECVQSSGPKVRRDYTQLAVRQ